VTFAPSPPSSPPRVRFAHVTQMKRDIANIRSGLTHYTSTPANHTLFEYAQQSPSVQELTSTVDDHGVPNKVYQEVYYSKETDAPDYAKEYAGILFRIRGGTGLSALEEWYREDKTPIPGLLIRKNDPLRLPRIIGIEGWEYSKCPPSRREVRSWLVENPVPREMEKRKIMLTSQVINYRGSNAVVLLTTTQIVGPTQAWSSSGVGQTLGKKAKAPTREQQFMSILSLEVFGMLGSPTNLGFSD
jgi:DNA polymerase zeta